ncbi:MAG: hypothetical protein B7Z55_15775 [Planctomycetales bacterium 12-60-4]|nr:MAG: hypothetical protein B7Z55_15775 [Planctomycetales bacterium 12-60-4]
MAGIALRSRNIVVTDLTIVMIFRNAPVIVIAANSRILQARHGSLPRHTQSCVLKFGWGGRGS